MKELKAAYEFIISKHLTLGLYFVAVCLHITLELCADLYPEEVNIMFTSIFRSQEQWYLISTFANVCTRVYFIFAIITSCIEYFSLQNITNEAPTIREHFSYIKSKWITVANIIAVTYVVNILGVCGGIEFAKRAIWFGIFATHGKFMLDTGRILSGSLIGFVVVIVYFRVVRKRK